MSVDHDRGAAAPARSDATTSAEDAHAGARPVPLLASPVLGYLLLAAFALFFLLGGRDLAFGELAQIGPGFFPTVFATILLVMALAGAAIEWRKVRAAAAGPAIRLDWRPLVFISLAVFVFAILVRRVGIVPASFAATVVASLSKSPVKPLAVGLIAAGVAFLVWLIFIFGLNLSIPAIRMPS